MRVIISTQRAKTQPLNLSLTVGGVAGDEGVHHALALPAGEALLVVGVPRRRHLLRVEHLKGII